MTWWCIEVRGRFIGRCYATEADIRAAAGPYYSIVGNLISIWGRP